ncbi:MAG: imidazole glycerol phosphate synthase subunit HisH [Clostridiales bacterium]|nr:imidazole glycerol phosphate synthase subunit HisH [Clostridiales bacterium]
MIAIVDYGVGNLFSLCSSFKKIGAEAVITSQKSVIENADKIILPGVGAFEDAAKKLRESGLGELVKEQAQKGKYMMGICLGMQLLLDKSFEYGEHDGLGLIHGNVTPIKGYVRSDLKVPHIGWNGLHFTKENFLFKYLKEGDHAYFVHSYHATDCQDVLATTEYDKALTAAIGKENVLGCQFHPEKSGDVGLNILRAFVEEKD